MKFCKRLQEKVEGNFERRMGKPERSFRRSKNFYVTEKPSANF